jgi:hypothetical protein
MTFFAYLCWLLGVSGPEVCDALGGGAISFEECAGDAPSRNAPPPPPPPPSQRGASSPPDRGHGSNINVSI